MIASSVNMYASHMCAINWRWWPFQFFQREYVFWVIMAIGDIIIIAESLSNDGSFYEESESTLITEKSIPRIGWLELCVWNKSFDRRCLGEKSGEIMGSVGDAEAPPSYG